MWELVRRASSRVSPLALRLNCDGSSSTRHYLASDDYNYYSGRPIIISRIA